MTAIDLYGDEFAEDEKLEAGEDLVLADTFAAAGSLRRYRYWERRLAEASAPFDTEMARLAERRDTVLGPIRRKMEWHASALERFHRAAFAAKAAQPTLKLPAGDTLLKRAAPVLEVVDEGELLAWAKGEGLDVLSEPTLSKTKLNKAVTILEDENAEPGATFLVVNPATGEPVPGVTSKARERSFSIVKEGTKS